MGSLYYELMYTEKNRPVFIGTFPGVEIFGL